jgi:hypothetical protein
MKRGLFSRLDHTPRENSSARIHYTLQEHLQVVNCATYLAREFVSLCAFAGALRSDSLEERIRAAFWRRSASNLPDGYLTSPGAAAWTIILVNQ